MLATGVRQVWVGQGGLQTQRKAWSLDPTLHPPYLFPAPAGGHCWAQLGSPFDSHLAGVLSSGGTDPGPQGPARPGHPYQLSVLPSSGRPGLCCMGPGPQARQKVRAGVYDLVSPIPVGTKLLPSSPCRSGLRARHSRARTPNPLHHTSGSTQLPGWGLPSCAGHTRMHTRTQAPPYPPHAGLPT